MWTPISGTYDAFSFTIQCLQQLTALTPKFVHVWSLAKTTGANNCNTLWSLADLRLQTSKHSILDLVSVLCILRQPVQKESDRSLSQHSSTNGPTCRRYLEERLLLHQFNTGPMKRVGQLKGV